MKTYKWQDVLDFIDENLETKFNMTHPFSSDRDPCVMCRFFESKNIPKFSHVNYAGFTAMNSNCQPVAEIKDPPTRTILDLFFGKFLDQEIVDGAEIKSILKK
jgi:hypothetical protein